MAYARIIPCLDVAGGRIVKGIKFKQLRDAGDPATSAAAYEKEGADEIVILDISATEEGRKTLVDTVKAVAEAIFIPLTVGGGISCLADAQRLFHAGADKVSVNTAAVNNPSLITDIANVYGSQAVVVAVDAAYEAVSDSWKVFVKGGKQSTGIDALEWCAEAERRGAGEILLTSIDRDGTQIGYDERLLESLTRLVHIPVIASGGAGNIKDFGIAAKAGASGLLAASLFHFGTLGIKEVKIQLEKEGIKTRMDCYREGII